MQHRHASFLRNCISFSIAVVVGTIVFGGCTYYIPAKLEASRSGDVLNVGIAGSGASRWDPRKDSLVIDCSSCDVASSRLVEHFYHEDEAQYEIQGFQGVTLTLYSLGITKTLTLPGNGTTLSTASGITPLREHRMHKAAHEEKVTTAAATETPEVAKTAKKVSSVKVTAAEGVAIYSDKTKTSVLKIVPQGTVLTLLSREGDLYSVSINGAEGFVDSEAVTEQ